MTTQPATETLMLPEIDLEWTRLKLAAEARLEQDREALKGLAASAMAFIEPHRDKVDVQRLGSGLLFAPQPAAPTQDDFEVTENDSGFFEARRRRGRPAGTRRKWLDRDPLIDKYVVCRRAIGRHPTEAEFAQRLGWSRAQLYIVLDSANLSYADLIRHFQQWQGATPLPEHGREQRGPNQSQSERRHL